MDGCVVGYLAQNFPSALAYAQRNRFSSKQITDLTAILNLVREKKLEITTSDVRIHDKVDDGSFGSIFKAVYRGKIVVLKRIEQVIKLTN
jgi:hypothetical protein